MVLRVVLLLLVASAAFSLKPLNKLLKDVKPVADDDGVNDEEKYLLPETVWPENYTLVLTTNIEKFEDGDFSFTGQVDIDVSVLEDVNEIILHKSKDMEIQSASLVKTDSSTVNLNFTVYDEETNKLTLTPEDGSTIPKGTYKIKISYKGQHDDDMHGFYRSSYVNSQNVSRWLVTTQFESYDARRAFPCFDEPKYKAKYTITIKVNKSLVEDQYGVLTNMPAEGEPTDEDDLKVFKFKVSEKKISSYLVAFIVSDFKKTDVAKFGGPEEKEFRTWGQSGPIESGEAATSQLAGPAALDVLKKKTGVSFGYPKVDQVGIPDFSAGAMENWGLVTYRERLIFFNESKHPLSQKQSVVTVTTHELAHQWFGDLVTLHWWSDIWLNEGFATFFEYHASSEIAVDGLNTSTWNLIGQMVVDELQAGAFATDAQPNSRPLTVEVYKPSDIDANFDDVAYSKGGSILRMWMHILGEKTFYAALNSYLSKNAENIGTPQLLLSELDDAASNANLSVKPLVDFENWHTQAGYPVLHVKRNGNQSVITQERYLVSGSDNSNLTWTVPISFTTSNSPNFTNTAPAIFFYEDQESITIDHEDAEWVLFNIQQTGYYRVNYDQAGWKALTNALINKTDDIPEINRAQLLDDAFWLARSTNNYGTNYEIPLNMTKYLENEKELIPWKAALNAFNFLYGKLAADEDAEPLLRKLILDRIENIFNELTLSVNGTVESHTVRLLRPQIVSWACRLEHEECIANATDLFNTFLKGGKNVVPTLHPDVKSTVMCTGIRASKDNSTWDALWGQYNSTTDNSEQTLILSALGCSKNEKILQRYLEMTLDPNSGIRRQDLSAVFSAVYNGNPGNVQIALNFLKNRLTDIAAQYGGMDPLGALLTGIAAKLGTQEDLDTITEIQKQISEDDNLQSGLPGAKRAIEIVASNKDWLDKKQDEIKVWLKSPANDSKGAASTFSVTFVAMLLPTLLAYLFSQ